MEMSDLAGLGGCGGRPFDAARPAYDDVHNDNRHFMCHRDTHTHGDTSKCVRYDNKYPAMQRSVLTLVGGICERRRLKKP
eukprot:8256802-Pyramimonas_sp.AAC.2